MRQMRVTHLVIHQMVSEVYFPIIRLYRDVAAVAVTSADLDRLTPMLSSSPEEDDCFDDYRLEGCGIRVLFFAFRDRDN